MVDIIGADHYMPSLNNAATFDVNLWIETHECLWQFAYARGKQFGVGEMAPRIYSTVDATSQQLDNIEAWSQKLASFYSAVRHQFPTGPGSITHIGWFQAHTFTNSGFGYGFVDVDSHGGQEQVTASFKAMMNRFKQSFRKEFVQCDVSLPDYPLTVPGQ